MTDSKKPRGGARPNSGRPKVADPAKNRTIKMNEADWLKFKAIGGVKWLRDVLSKLGDI